MLGDGHRLSGCGSAADRALLSLSAASAAGCSCGGSLCHHVKRGDTSTSGGLNPLTGSLFGLILGRGEIGFAIVWSVFPPLT